jgi:hypothetical protein
MIQLGKCSNSDSTATVETSSLLEATQAFLLEGKDWWPSLNLERFFDRLIF